MANYRRGQQSAPAAPAAPPPPAPAPSAPSAPRGGTRPVYTAMVGPIKVTVWANAGERGTWYSIRITREVYDEKTRQWSSYDSFSPSQAALAATLLNQAVAVTIDLKENDKGAAQHAQTGGDDVGF